jgi:OOP family OmpA-OmpF porin
MKHIVGCSLAAFLGRDDMASVKPTSRDRMKRLAMPYIAVATALVAGNALFSASVQAQTMRMSDELGFYVGASFAGAKTKDLCSSAAEAGMAVSSCDEKDKSWKISAGYQFHPNVAVELGFVDLGTYKVAGTFAGTPIAVNVDVKAIELVAVGIFPVTREFSVYGKAGLFRWDTDPKVTGPFIVTTEDGTDFTFGVGVKYNFTRNLAARIEWQRYTDADINTVGVGVLYAFR